MAHQMEPQAREANRRRPKKKGRERSEQVSGAACSPSGSSADIAARSTSGRGAMDRSHSQQPFCREEN